MILDEAPGNFVHFQSRQCFAPAAAGCCEDVEIVEEGVAEEELWCPFHSDNEIRVRITHDNWDKKRWEREQVALKAEKKKQKGKYFGKVVKGIIFAA